MLPSSIDEYVSPDNIVCFMDAFVDKIIAAYPDLFQKGKSKGGRPSYSPNCLSKLLLYGYFNSVSSSRKPERETQLNMEVIWLLNNLRPDHWSISDFRKENKASIKRMAIDFRKFLKDSGYITGKSLSTDGTKIKAYASRDTLSIGLIEKKLEKAEMEIERYLSRLEAEDEDGNRQESMTESADELKKQIADLELQVSELRSQKAMPERENIDAYVPADPQARVMKTKDGFLPCYNVQMTIDNDSHFITSFEATDYPNDYHSLKENIDTVESQPDIVPDDVLADGGYACEDDIRLLEEKGIEVIVPFAGESETKKVQRDKGVTFQYDEEADRFICSQGRTLSCIKRKCKKKNRYYDRYQSPDCSGCPLKQYCTTSKKGRIIYRRLDGEWLKNYRKKMQTPAFKKKFKRRKCVGEHPFGTMKYYMGQIPILLRGKEKVQVEMDLYSTAYNLRHLFNITTVPELLTKLAGWHPNVVSSIVFSFLTSLFGRKKLFFAPVFSN
jgi:transposase